MIRITREITVAEEGKKLTVSPYDGLKISCAIDFDHAVIRKQECSVEINAKAFDSEIASARTFGFLDEVEMLKENGLALGGSLDNAVVIDRYGVLNEEGLRFSDEFVRHKVLDILGDIALLGFPLLGHLQADKSGHSLHLKLMQEIANQPECWEYVECEDNDTKVIEKVVTKTRDARDRILPYLVPPSRRPYAGGQCSI